MEVTHLFLLPTNRIYTTKPGASSQEAPGLFYRYTAMFLAFFSCLGNNVDGLSLYKCFEILSGHAHQPLPS